MNVQRRSRNPLGLCIGLTLSASLFATFYFGPSSLYSLTKHTTMTTDTPFLDNLQISLSQSSSSSETSPPTVSVSVKNTHPSEPVTLLTWESPLDSAALGLGLVSITPSGSTEPVHIEAIKISRLMPLDTSSLVTLRPGESATNDVELREPMVPSEVWNAGKAKVGMKGRWMAVWPGLTKHELQQDAKRLQSVGAGAGGSLTGNWESEVVEIG